ncbi:MAG: CPBP family intramembrane metalloprotease [Acidobacteriota bacterium]|nr:CPBP family intramembrane metalloprotease [Acidobacteriota bacterium]
MSEPEAVQRDVRRLLAENKWAQTAEILAVFAVAFAVLGIGRPWVGENPLRFQAIVWVANILMLATIWLGLRLRGQGWEHLGLAFRPIDRRAFFGALWKSLVVFVAALAGFILGAIVMANIVGRPEQADMSGYNYLAGNLPMLMVALVGVFIASSLGEEILYRGFLITRLEALGGASKTALRTAVVVSSIIFGLVHFAWGPMGIVQTGFMGLALAISFLVLKRNLWILVVAHFYLDAILLIQMYLAPGQ